MKQLEKIGYQINQFEIQKKICNTNFGYLFNGIDKKEGNKILMKVIPKINV